MVWILIIYIFGSGGGDVETIGEFATRWDCVAAGRQIAAASPYVSFDCIYSRKTQ